MSIPDFHPDRCPLCQRANECGARRTDRPCWCTNVEIPANVLDRIPVAARNAACICQSCVETGVAVNARVRRLMARIRN